MTKIMKYFGRDPLWVTNERELNSRDFRMTYKCNACGKVNPMGKTITFGSDLHACKGNKECRDGVSDIYHQKKKTFDRNIFLEERKDFHLKNGIDINLARMYAKLDLENKLRELKLVKKTKKTKKINMNRKSRERFSKRAILANKYFGQGMTRSEAWKRATREENI